MHIYRISIVLNNGSRLSYNGLFKDGFEAALQAKAEWPDAKSIRAINLMNIQTKKVSA